MKTRLPLSTLALLASLSTLNPQLSTCFAQDTAFTYQGRLTENGSPANGVYDFRFTACGDAVLSGFQVGQPQTNNAVGITNGLFTTIVDLLSFADSQPRWLEVAVRPTGSTNDFAALGPRQLVTVSPKADYANRAATLTGTLTEGLLPGSAMRDYVNETVTGFYTFDPLPGNPPFAVNSAVLVPNLNADKLDGLDAAAFWRLGGNAGTKPGTDFLGTTDSQPLDLKVNGQPALRFAPGPTGPNLLGGLAAFYPTVIGSGVSGAVVAGGGAPAGPVSGWGAGDFHAVFDSDGTVGGGFGNKIGTDNGNPDDSPFGTVAGGVFNSAANFASTVAGGDGNMAGGVRSAVSGGAGNAAWATDSAVGGGLNNLVAAGAANGVISGGRQNTIRANASDTTIGGGYANLIAEGANSATIAGGEANTNTAIRATIGGGWLNRIGLDSWEAVVSGGSLNTIEDNAPFSTLAGGRENRIGLDADLATVGGGFANIASGYAATVPGGIQCEADGEASLAAGYRARAVHHNSFVWSDASSQSGFDSTAANQFAARSRGGALFDVGASAFQVQGASLVSKPASTLNTARQLAISHTGNGDWGLNLGYLYNPGVEAAGVIQALDGVAATSLYLNAAGGDVLWGAKPANHWSAARLSPDQGGILELGNSRLANALPYIDFHFGVNSDQDFNVRLMNDADRQLSVQGNLRVTENVTCKSLTILGGADLAEPFAMSENGIRPGSVVVIDEDNPGRLKLSQRSCDHKVAGVVSGAKDIQPGISMIQVGALEAGQNVALSGRVYALADAAEGAISPGDLLTTSNTPGHAMKAPNPASAHGAILGKAMTGLKEGRGLVLMLVTLQ